MDEHLLRGFSTRQYPQIQCYLALCLRFVVAITNEEWGDNLGSTAITV